LGSMAFSYGLCLAKAHVRRPLKRLEAAVLAELSRRVVELFLTYKRLEFSWLLP
jgi:hypothetical protein